MDDTEEKAKDSLAPKDIVAAMIRAGGAKAALSPFDLLVRGFLSGALLGFATSLASAPPCRRANFWSAR